MAETPVAQVAAPATSDNVGAVSKRALNWQHVSLPLQLPNLFRLLYACLPRCLEIVLM
jgi:hypothetical protein